MYRNHTYERNGKTWVKKWETAHFDTPGVGVFLGYRSLQTGSVEYEYDYGSYFVENGPRVKAALVCEGPRKNPIYVDPRGVEVINKE